MAISRATRCDPAAQQPQHQLLVFSLCAQQVPHLQHRLLPQLLQQQQCAQRPPERAPSAGPRGARKAARHQLPISSPCNQQDSALAALCPAPAPTCQKAPKTGRGLGHQPGRALRGRQHSSRCTSSSFLPLVVGRFRARSSSSSSGIVLARSSSPLRCARAPLPLGSPSAARGHAGVGHTQDRLPISMEVPFHNQSAEHTSGFCSFGSLPCQRQPIISPFTRFSIAH